MTLSGRQPSLPPGQLNFSAHPIVFVPAPGYTPLPPQELQVADVRSRDNEASGRVFSFTVRNTGPNPVGLYYVYVSLVSF